jgi:hypothetical protein
MLSCSGCQGLYEQYTPEKIKTMQIICPSPDGYGNTKKVSRAKRAHKTSAEVTSASKAVASTSTAVAVTSTAAMRFTDLCEDVIRLVCEYLDIESHISLYLAYGQKAVKDKLYQKIQTMKYSCIYTYTHVPKPDGRWKIKSSRAIAERDTDLLYYLAMLKPTERNQLKIACGGHIPLNLGRGLKRLQPLLCDHAQLLQTPRYKADAKRYLQQYGALRAKPDARTYIEKRAMECVLRRPNARLLDFIALVFDINIKPNEWITGPTNHTPHSFQDPWQALEEMFQEIQPILLKDTEEQLAMYYKNWHRYFITSESRLQKYGPIAIAADERYKEVMKIMQVEKTCRLHEKIYRAYLQHNGVGHGEAKHNEVDHSDVDHIEWQIQTELKMYRTVIKQMQV